MSLTVRKERSQGFARGKAGRSDWQESDDYGYQEFHTPDGKRKITVSFFCGEEYGNNVIQNAILSAKSRISCSMPEMMRVQAVSEPTDPPTISYNVYLDVIAAKRAKAGFVLTNAQYYASRGGRIKIGNSWSGPTKPPESDLSDEEFQKLYIEEMKAEGLYHQDELPLEIDTGATVQAFRAQIKRRDFSRPVLVPKPAQIGNAPLALIKR